MAQLFGFEFGKSKEEEKAKIASFVPKEDDDGAVLVQGSGVYGTYVDFDGSIRSEAELVSKYREVSNHPEVDMAIDDIVNEMITQEPEDSPVEIILDKVEQSDKVKKLIIEEFDNVQRLLEFHTLSYEIVRRWYVDGRLYYHAVTDEANPKRGIIELRYIDPRKIRKIKEIKKEKLAGAIDINVPVSEYFIYNERGFAKTSGTAATPTNNNVGGIKIAKDSIVHCTSGLVSDNGDLVKGYLHKAMKPLNQLRSMEDSLVIYRISRAPERRIFYIDVGNLPKSKAEQYVRDLQIRFKNKLVYDSASGEIRDDRKFMTMLEDFWLPRSGGGRGTEITTLPGGQNLSELDDVVYFQRKLYKSLNVPITRLEPETTYSLGRATEITRDEVKFAKFINRLRNKFSALFLSILEKQLVLKNIMSLEDWEEIKHNVRFQYAEDNYYAELKETEILRDRVSMLRDMDDYIGKYWSHENVRRNILKQSDEDIEENDKQIAEEKDDPQFNPPLDPNMDGGPGGMDQNDDGQADFNPNPQPLDSNPPQPK